MVVSDHDAHNFAFVLPPLDNDNLPGPHIVISTSLPMGWTLSPPYFCSASKTGRDIAANFLQAPMGSLPSHPLEDYMLGLVSPEALYPSSMFPFPWATPPDALMCQKLLWLIGVHHAHIFALTEVYMDDYISIICSSHIEAL